MVYVSGGQVCDSRPWSLASIPEYFWGFLNVVVLFFKTMVQPDLTSKGSNSDSSYRAGSSGGGGPRGPPPGPRRRMGGFGGRGGGPSSPPMAGGG